MSGSLQSIPALPLLGSNPTPFSLSWGPVGKAMALQPGVAAQALDQVTIGQGGVSYLTKALSPQGMQSLNGVAQHSDAEVRQVAKNFESLFLQMLMKEMRNTVQKSDLMGNSRGMEFFESMYDEQMTQQLASAGGIGLGQVIYQKLKSATTPHLKTFS